MDEVVDPNAELRKARALISRLEARLSEKELELTKVTARTAEVERELEETKAHRRLGEACPTPNGMYVHGERLTDGDFNLVNVRAAVHACLCTTLPSRVPPSRPDHLLKPSPS